MSKYKHISDDISKCPKCGSNEVDIYESSETMTESVDRISCCKCGLLWSAFSEVVRTVEYLAIDGEDYPVLHEVL